MTALFSLKLLKTLRAPRMSWAQAKGPVITRLNMGLHPLLCRRVDTLRGRPATPPGAKMQRSDMSSSIRFKIAAITAASILAATVIAALASGWRESERRFATKLGELEGIAAGREAHALKSMCRNVGATRLAAWLENVEQAAARAHLPDRAASDEVLRTELHHALSALRQLAGRLDSDAQVAA